MKKTVALIAMLAGINICSAAKETDVVLNSAFEELTRTKLAMFDASMKGASEVNTQILGSDNAPQVAKDLAAKSNQLISDANKMNNGPAPHLSENAKAAEKRKWTKEILAGEGILILLAKEALDLSNLAVVVWALSEEDNQAPK